MNKFVISFNSESDSFDLNSDNIMELAVFNDLGNKLTSQKIRVEINKKGDARKI